MRFISGGPTFNQLPHPRVAAPNFQREILMPGQALGWWFQRSLIFTPILGEMIPKLTFIFFNWVGSTTNQDFVLLGEGENTLVNIADWKMEPD